MLSITFGLLDALHIKQILIISGILMKMTENLESARLNVRMNGYFCAIIQLPILLPCP